MMDSSRNPFHPLPCNFADILESSKFSDFTIYVPNAENEKDSSLRVHRFILDSQSSFFHDFFSRTPEEKSITLCFPQYAVPWIKKVLHFIYSSEEIEFTNENIAPIFFISTTWGVGKICKEANNFILTKLSPEFALDTLSKLSAQLSNNTDAVKHLIDTIYKNISIYKPEDFSDLPFDIFDQILSLVNASRPLGDAVNALCSCLEYYVKENINKLGKNEFETLIQRFNLKTNHSGILTLYKYSIQFDWGVRFAHPKVLHSWRYLEQKELARLPLKNLNRLLSENYINTNGEDEILDFILLACQEHKKEDEELLKLWDNLRVPSLSSHHKELLKNCEIAPKEVKEKLNEEPSKYLTRRVPLAVQKLLILGAADDLSLKDVKELLVSACFVEENIKTVRADKEIHDEDFSDYHAILVFGFYKFFNARKLSEKLANYVMDGGGLVVAYGANRTDDFGLGEPLLSLLPIDPYRVDSFNESTNHPEAQEEKEQTIGNKNMRLLFKAKANTAVISQWDDGVPFIVSQWKTQKRGGIVVFNATPVSSDVIPQQWSKHDKSMGRLIVNAIVSVASICFSKNKR